ncbi:MAG: ORF6N domain-containing protein, partial [Myxococcaceae bacterium]
MEITTNELRNRIYTLRGVQVMLDSDLAEMYGVEPRALKQAVRRNIKRFPNDFMFEPTNGEPENLRSQSVISSLENSSKTDTKPILRSQIVISSFEEPIQQHGGSRYTSFVFTESGIAMLSSVLNSQRAIEVNIAIMRAFVQLKKQHKDKLEILDNKLDLILQKLDASKAEPKAKERDPVRLIQDAVARYWGIKTEDLIS